MAYSEELEAKMIELGIKKENILYLTIENVNIQEMRDGAKNTEYREVTELYLSRLFSKNAEKKFQKMKPKTHILFQGGYNPDSPRIIIELLGFSVGNQIFPQDGELKQNYRLYEALDMFLGNIVYDSKNADLIISPIRKTKATIASKSTKQKSKGKSILTSSRDSKNNESFTYTYNVTE
ncbi:hypothetical protein Q73A0000_05040 [Kaistella flava (ex Peng et al. 2021)]|uniref:Uncharacterized protein n=1 Tax=Kaistella flava (ex Peng et al. 2021) TaxID=2038776 RepID=A0A7M2Y6A5_9FLAO|nr:hypothetical protein [Kaistella flava (ex Peng et al. 2021)]QOW09777.1 hypothetical protein Q73A0000_05040 [Kaistella flava (ex Peng et al. 2021)]